MAAPRTHSIDELERLSGFNQRTIAYYIQQGLLPKVGRRGPSTRYPHLFVDRLRFIQRVRDLQDAGRLGSVTLPKIAAVIWHLVHRRGPDVEIAEIDQPEIERLFSNAAINEVRHLGETEAGQAVTASFGKFGPYVRAGETTASIKAEEFFRITRDDAVERIRAEDVEKRKRASSRKERMVARFNEPEARAAPPAVVEDVFSSSMDFLAMEAKPLEPQEPPKPPEPPKPRQPPKPPEPPEPQEPPEPPKPLEPPEPAASAAPAKAMSARVGAVQRPGDTAAVSELRWLVRALQSRSRPVPPGTFSSGDLWTRVPLVEGIELFIRADDPKDRKLVERIADKLRALLSEG